MKKIIKKLSPLFAATVLAASVPAFAATKGDGENVHSHALKAKAAVERFRNALTSIKIGSITLESHVANQLSQGKQRAINPLHGTPAEAAKIEGEDFARWNSELSKTVSSAGFNVTSFGKGAEADAKNVALVSLMSKLSNEQLDAALSNEAYKATLVKNINDLAQIGGLTEANIAAFANVIKSDLVIENGTATTSGTTSQLQTVRNDILKKFVTTSNGLGEKIAQDIASGTKGETAIAKALTNHLTAAGINATALSAHIKSFAEANKDANNPAAIAKLLKSDKSPAAEAIRRGLFEAETNKHLEGKLTKEEIEYFKNACGAMAKAA